MKTFGQTLQTARERSNLTQAALAKKIHIPLETLISLEEDKSENLPARTLVRGYVQLLSQELKLSEEAMLALWRRDATTTASTSLPSRKRKGWFFGATFSPRNFSLSLLLLAAFIGSATVFVQWKRLRQPPELSIESPVNMSIVTSPVQIKGKTHPNNTLIINTLPISLDQQGRFEYELELPPGERAIVVNAKDSRERQSESIIFVTVSP